MVPSSNSRPRAKPTRSEDQETEGVTNSLSSQVSILALGRDSVHPSPEARYAAGHGETQFLLSMSHKWES